MELAFWSGEIWWSKLLTCDIRVTALCLCKLVVGSKISNVISVYAPQIGLDEDIKRLFWEDLNVVIQSIPHNEEIFIRVTLMDI